MSFSRKSSISIVSTLTGDCPCADGWVKYKGEWVQPTDEEADEAGYKRSDTASACGCITWVKKERRELFGGECEDAADEVVAATSEEAMGTRIEGCAELVAVMGDGACGHELLQTQCPATCGLCDDFEAQDRLMNGMRGRQMVAKPCGE